MFKGLLFFIRAGWKHDKKYIVWLIMSRLVASMIPIIGAILPKLVIDELGNGQRVERLAAYIGVFAGYMLLANALSAFLTKDCFTHRCRVDAAFHLDLHAQLTQADFENLESPAFKDIQAKAQKFLTCDFHGFGYLLDCAMNIIGQIITALGLVAVMSSMDGWFVAMFTVLAVCSSIIESRATKKAMDISMDVVQTSRQWMYLIGLIESARWAKEIRLNRLGPWLLEREHRMSSIANDCLKRSNDCYIASGIKRAGLTFIQQCTAYGVLVAKVLSGSLSIGSFTMCISAVTSFAEALRQMMDSLVEIRAYDLYYDHLDNYLSTPQTLRTGKKLPVGDGPFCIEFQDVGFRYAGAENWALRHISLTLHPGEKLALVGENGSGKTTLIKLLCRLYDPTEGRILVNGTDIRDFDYDEVMDLFAAVFQDFQLFDFSLRDNIALGRAIPDPQIIQALKSVGLDERLKRLPRGLNTFIGREFDEHGFLPSGGEAQRIALARSLLKDAPVIILDEPTAAMDPRAEHDLYRMFDRLVGKKSAVYISHRMSSCRFCDKIAVLERGRLAEYGTHCELIARSGIYSEMYSLQAQYYSD